MKTYTKEQIDEILRKHKLWVDNVEGGDRADLSDSDLSGSNLSGSDLRDSDLRGSNLSGIVVKKIQVFAGLYQYQTWAVISDKNEIHIRMGCFFRSLAEWDKDFWNNQKEFPNDGSEKSIQRLKAFEFTKDWALRNLELIKSKEGIVFKYEQITDDPDDYHYVLKCRVGCLNAQKMYGKRDIEDMSENVLYKIIDEEIRQMRKAIFGELRNAK